MTNSRRAFRGTAVEKHWCMWPPVILFVIVQEFVRILIGFIQLQTPIFWHTFIQEQ